MHQLVRGLLMPRTVIGLLDRVILTRTRTVILSRYWKKQIRITRYRTVPAAAASRPGCERPVGEPIRVNPSWLLVRPGCDPSWCNPSWCDPSSGLHRIPSHFARYSEPFACLADFRRYSEPRYRIRSGLYSEKLFRSQDTTGTVVRPRG